MARGSWFPDLIRSMLIVILAVFGLVGCDDAPLRDIERGTDAPPGIEGSPPDEGS